MEGELAMTPDLSAYLPPPPDETDLQRVRRRLQQRRCLGCGSPDREPRLHMCAGCKEKVQYCNRCEQVKPVAAFGRHGDWCRACHIERKRSQDPEAGKWRMRIGAARGHAAVRARREQTSGQIAHWHDERGWTFAEIGRALGISANAARIRYRYHKAAERNQVEER